MKEVCQSQEILQVCLTSATLILPDMSPFLYLLSTQGNMELEENDELWNQMDHSLNHGSITS